MRRLRQVGVVLGLLLVATSVASAQRTTTRSAAQAAKPWEFGFDAGLALGLDDQGTSLSIPLQNVRAGYHTSDVLSIEPFGAIQYFDPEVGDGVTLYNLGVGGLYHFSTSRTATQLYVRPFLMLAGISTSGASDSEIGGGIGAGMKWPRLNGRMAMRGEVNLTAISDATALNFLFGLSFFTR
ncbi:MAG TPA: outer membrane beta-barrel protein [Gemmatimonadaceae bacterium]|nr:outer membrane beta-barrel protein [Gemmatimonadaceae bacterium]